MYFVKPDQDCEKLINVPWFLNENRDEAITGDRGRFINWKTEIAKNQGYLKYCFEQGVFKRPKIEDFEIDQWRNGYFIYHKPSDRYLRKTENEVFGENMYGENGNYGNMVNYFDTREEAEEFLNNWIKDIDSTESNEKTQTMKDYDWSGGFYSVKFKDCLLYTSPSPRDRQKSRMPSSA